MEHPPFWCYLPGNNGIFLGHVSLPESISFVLGETLEEMLCTVKGATCASCGLSCSRMPTRCQLSPIFHHLFHQKSTFLRPFQMSTNLHLPTGLSFFHFFRQRCLYWHVRLWYLRFSSPSFWQASILKWTNVFETWPQRTGLWSCSWSLLRPVTQPCIRCPVTFVWLDTHIVWSECDGGHHDCGLVGRIGFESLKEIWTRQTRPTAQGNLTALRNIPWIFFTRHNFRIYCNVPFFGFKKLLKQDFQKTYPP